MVSIYIIWSVCILILDQGMPVMVLGDMLALEITVIRNNCASVEYFYYTIKMIKADDD